MQRVKWVALLASLMVAAQIIILLLGQEGLCLSQGCQVVDQLTKVPPLWFNFTGLFFFQAVFWCLFRVNDERTNRVQLVRLLLLAGLAAEGVLVGFQQIIAGTFCTYCLIVLGFITLLNVLAGIKQLLTSFFVFGVVLLAFSSLEYNSSHCQRVLEAMRNNAVISMHFNPIDTISSLAVPEVILNPRYSAGANKALLTTLGIEEIPVLLVRTTNGFSIVKGESACIAFLDSLATPSRKSENMPNIHSSATSINNPLLPPAENQESCSVDTSCDSPPSLPGINPSR